MAGNWRITKTEEKKLQNKNNKTHKKKYKTQNETIEIG